MKSFWLASLLAVTVAQTRPAPQTRDNTPPPVGTAAISGRVFVDDSSGQPLRRTMIMLSSGGLLMPQMTVTDDAGRYRFTGLLRGSYTLAATRAGYVTTFYGSKSVGKGPGVPIAVLDGQQISNINLKLPRGGVITGIVRSPTGQPAPGIDVQVMLVQTVDGQRRMASSIAALAALAGDSTSTDDRGVYRIFGLSPGDYVVQANMRPTFGMSEGRQVTAAEVRWAQLAAAQAPAGVVTPGAPALPASPAPGHSVAYSPVYYPGTAVATEAALVSVGAGEERRGIDFSTQLVPTAVITGTVLDPDGRPLEGVQVSLRDSESGSQFLGFLRGGASSATTNASGTFSLAGVKPGRYAVTARGGPRQGRGSLESILGAGRGRGGDPAATPDLAVLAGLLGSAQPWWAREEVGIDGNDVTGLTLRMQPGMTLSGRIVYEGASPAPTDLTKTRVTFGAMPTSVSPLEMVNSMMGGDTLATTAADGTFTAKGVVPGKYRGSVGGGMSAILSMFSSTPAKPDNWTLKSMMWNGRDIADVPLEVRPSEDVTGIVVSFTDQPTELSGTVVDQTDKATGNFPIVVFATDKTYWTIGSRRVRQARPASDGKFKIAGLPAGEYFVIAVTDVDAEDLYNPVFLEQLSTSGALKIRLADGQKIEQNLKLR